MSFHTGIHLIGASVRFSQYNDGGESRIVLDQQHGGATMRVCLSISREQRDRLRAVLDEADAAEQQLERAA